jgi:hypothetical protein
MDERGANLPTAAFASTKLVLKTIAAGARHWGRIYPSRYPDPLGIGKTPSRFSDPRVELVAERRFGVLYASSTFEGCVFETFLRRRDLEPAQLVFGLGELKQRLHAEVVVEADLKLVDLTRRGPIKMGVPSDVAHHSNHKLAQQWALAFHEHAQEVDGIYYVSLLHTGMFNLAIFDRAVGKLSTRNQVAVPMHPQWPALVKRMDIAIIDTFEDD